MKYHWLIYILPALLYADASQAMPSARDSFAAIKRCVSDEDSSRCRQLVTADSVPTYDRFSSYGLLKCLPKDAAYVSQKDLGDQTIIRTKFSIGTTPRFTKLVFVEEEGEWKLSVPESLRLGLGENWQQRLAMTEQVYLMLKAQMGPTLECGAIQNLGAGF